VDTLKIEDQNMDIVTTIRGILIPADWDERGNIIAATVSTCFEEDYLIEQSPRAEELLAYVRQRVKIRGLVKQEESGKKVVTVENFEILEE